MKNIYNLLKRYGTYYDSFLSLQKKNKYFILENIGFISYRTYSDCIYVNCIIAKENSKKELVTTFESQPNISDKRNILYFGIEKNDLDVFEKYSITEFEKEAIVDLRNHKPSYSMRHKLKKASTNLEFKEFSFKDVISNIDEIVLISKDWQKEKGQEEMTFVTEMFTLNFMKVRRFFVVINKVNKRIEGYVITNPKFKQLSFEFDIFRRRSDSNHYTMDFLVENILNKFKNEGIDECSLSDSIGNIDKNNIYTRNESKILKNVLYFLYNYFTFIINLKSLFLFKQKFKPIWRSRYICSKKKVGLRDIFGAFKIIHFL